MIHTINLDIALRPDEKLVREFTISARLVWFLIGAGIFLAIVIPIFGGWFLVAFGFGVSAGVVTVLTGAGLAFGALLVGYAFYFRASRHYVLTDQRFLETMGFLSKRTITANYEQVTDIRVHQDAFERLILGTGLVAINTAGADIEEIRLERVADPYRLSSHIRELCEARLRSVGLPVGHEVRSEAVRPVVSATPPEPRPTGPPVAPPAIEPSPLGGNPVGAAPPSAGQGTASDEQRGGE